MIKFIKNVIIRLIKEALLMAVYIFAVVCMLYTIIDVTSIKESEEVVQAPSFFKNVNLVNIELPQEYFKSRISDELRYNATTDEIKMIAQVVMAEAEAEPVLGQRLVIDTILNRVDSDSWPDSIIEVIEQPNQYSSSDNARFNRCYPKESLIELVKEELQHRTDHEVIFFRTKHYHKCGAPVAMVGNHYFCKMR